MDEQEAQNNGKIDEAYLDELVLKSQNGDHDAFSKIYDLLVDKVYRYVFFKTHPSEVEDIVAQGFIRVWTKIKQYQKRDVSFRAWFFRIIKNVVLDHHRYHRSLSELHDNIADDRSDMNPKKTAEDSLQSAFLRSAISELKEQYQQVLIMKFINDLPNDEIAQILGKHETTIRVLQFRGLALLRKILLRKGVDL